MCDQVWPNCDQIDQIDQSDQSDQIDQIDQSDQGIQSSFLTIFDAHLQNI